MTATAPLSPLTRRYLDIPVADGTLRALRWGDGPRLVLAVHGITANAACWQAVARFLSPGWTLIAVDLRGRAGSAGLPGPYGLDRHAADLLEVAGYLASQGHPRPVLAGHSLGAYIALLAAADRPQSFVRMVLVDGGLSLPLPEGIKAEDVVAATLGPSFARLRETYPTEKAYFDFWRAHPALKGSWNADIEDYLRRDLTGAPGALRSGVSEAAVLADGTDLLVAEPRVTAALKALQLPTVLLTAPAGLLGSPPGLLPEPLVAHWSEKPGFSAESVPSTNHYTILMDYAAAARLAARLTGEEPVAHR